MGKDNEKEIKIKVEAGGEEEKEKQGSTGGSPGGNEPQQGVQPQQTVVPDPLGYAEQRAAAATGAKPAYYIPQGPGMTPEKTAAYINDKEIEQIGKRPELQDLSVSDGARQTIAGKNKAETNAQTAARKELEAKGAFEQGYEEQQQLDAMSELLKEANGRVGTAQQEYGALVEQDEAAQRNERSRKVIAGLGDAISSIVNLVGTTQGAYDQQQTFMEPRLRDVIEQDRQRRYAKMERARANVQEQINAVNNLKLTTERMRQQKEQADAANALKRAELGMKADQQNWERDFKTNKAMSDAILNQQKLDATDRYNQGRLAEQSRHNRASEYYRGQSIQSRDQHYRNTEEIQRQRAAGGGSGKWYDNINYDEFKDEMAKTLGYSSWKDALTNKRGENRTILNEIASADNPTKQRAVIQSYINQVPEFKKKYWPGGGAVPTGAVNEDNAPWMEEEEDDEEKAPWL